MPLVVLSSGFGTTVQDCGRFGFRKFGVTVTGALDSAALRIANLLVGNDECAAGLEIASGRLRLQFTDDRLIAWSGGNFAVNVGATSVPALHCARASAGASCEILANGGRAWLAISGGIDVPQVLGSRSTDLRAAFGGLKGRAVRDGDELPLRKVSARSNRIAAELRGNIADWSAPQLTTLGNTLRTTRGNHWEDELELMNGTFRVSINSDRMGLRLEGASIRLNIEELVSEAVAPGTIQLPRDGAPILLLADCQTIGGYPKLAHVITVDLARAAQLQPMDEVSFELTTLDDARDLLCQREQDLAIFRAGLQARFG
jgi:antagonist of KipI